MKNVPITINVEAILTHTHSFLRRFQSTIVVVVTVTFLIAALLHITAIVTETPANNADGTTQPITNVDQRTIERLNELTASDNSTGVALPDGRTDPFSE